MSTHYGIMKAKDKLFTIDLLLLSINALIASGDYLTSDFINNYTYELIPKNRNAKFRFMESIRIKTDILIHKNRMLSTEKSLLRECKLQTSKFGEHTARLYLLATYYHFVKCKLSTASIVERLYYDEMYSIKEINLLKSLLAET